MTMAEIFRQLADKLDQIESGASDIPDQKADDDDVMINPQQAKIELLKKGVGVESAYDDECDDSSELDAIRRNAGINPTVLDIASGDSPLE